MLNRTMYRRLRPDLQPQDIERIMYEHGNGDLLPESQIVDSKDHMFASSFDQEAPCLRGLPVSHAFPSIPMGRYVPPGISTPDNIRSMMRAPLSGSTVSGDGTGDGSHDGSTHDGDSDEVCAPSRRATGLRSAQQCKKRKIPDEDEDYSEEDEGSSRARNKRMQANRLSAQRSRERKLKKDAKLRDEVEVLNDQIGGLEAKEKNLLGFEEALAKQFQAEQKRIGVEYDDLKIVLRDLGNVNKSLQISCDQILEAYPHLAHQAPEISSYLQQNPDMMCRFFPAHYIRMYSCR